MSSPCFVCVVLVLFCISLVVCVCYGEIASCGKVMYFPQQARKNLTERIREALFHSPNWTRTSDTLINSQVLYRLSYGGSHLWEEYPAVTTVDKCYEFASQIPRYLFV